MSEIRSAFESSFLVIRLATLEPQKQSTLGRYLARYTTHTMEAACLVGMIIIALGAWLQSPAALVGGFPRHRARMDARIAASGKT